MGKLIGHHIRYKSSILDIGCGNMLISQYLARQHKARVQGIDVLDMNLTDLPHTLYDGFRIPYPDKTFDTSLLIAVLHHVSDQQALLKEAMRVTSRNVIVFEDTYTTRIGKVWIKIRDVVGNLPEEAQMHFALNFRSTEAWERLFNQHQLRVVSRKVLWSHIRFTHHVLYHLTV